MYNISRNPLLKHSQICILFSFTVQSRPISAAVQQRLSTVNLKLILKTRVSALGHIDKQQWYTIGKMVGYSRTCGCWIHFGKKKKPHIYNLEAESTSIHQGCSSLSQRWYFTLHLLWGCSQASRETSLQCVLGLCTVEHAWITSIPVKVPLFVRNLFSTFDPAPEGAMSCRQPGSGTIWWFNQDTFLIPGGKFHFFFQYNQEDRESVQGSLQKCPLSSAPY